MKEQNGGQWEDEVQKTQCRVTNDTELGKREEKQEEYL